MSIADRITSMSNNLSNAYDGIEYLGVDTTGVDKNLQNLSSMLNVVYEGLPKISDEGVSPSIDGSRVGRLKSTLKASDTTQGSTTRKQLFDKNDSSIVPDRRISTGTGSTYNSNGYSTSPYIEVEPSTRYTLTSGISSYSCWYDANKDKLTGGAWDTGNFKTSHADAKYVRFDFKTEDIDTVMLEQGSEATSYEPYTGGIPSPSPDFPQSIHVVKGNNTVEVCGKNLYNGTYSAGKGINSSGNEYSATGQNASKYIPVQPNTTYTLFIPSNIYTLARYKSDKTFITRNLPSSASSYTFTTSEDCYYIRFSGYTENWDKTQLELGSEATTSEQYTGTTYPINLPVQNLLPTDENAWEQGTISGTAGVNQDSTTRIRTIDYYPIKNDIDYYASVQDTNYCFLNIILYNTSKNCVGAYYTISTLISGATSLKINIPSSIIPNVAYMRVTLRKAAGTTSDTILPSEVSTIKPMIEPGDKANRYTPYGVAPIELCKTDTNQDKLFKAIVGDTVYDTLTTEQKEGLVSGGWYEYGEVGKVVLNGSEGWAYDNHLDTPEARTIIRLANSGYQTSQYIASHFIQGSTTANKIVSSSTTMYLSLADSITGVLENDTEQEMLNKMKAWLNTHNVDFYYQLATPTITQITDSTLISQLEALYSAMSKNGQTNVLQTNADLPFIISASALKGE